MRLKKPRPIDSEWSGWKPVNIIKSEVFRRSRCCNAKILGAITDTMMHGTCTGCNEVVVQYNGSHVRWKNKLEKTLGGIIRES